VSAALGICYKRTYEGEPAIALESVAAQGRSSKVEVLPRILKKNGSFILETSALLSDVITGLKKHKREDLAVAAQRALAMGLAQMAVEVANSSGRGIIGISGGVAINAEIVRQVREIVLNAGLTFIQHAAVPPGDGGISLGQAVTVLAQYCDL
jgi:hydrogenase maturation protein HypF